MANFYQPSGKYSPVSFLYFILIALIALPILGLAYAYAIWYIPFIYVNFIIAGAFGFGVGWVISKVGVNKGKVRNKLIAAGFGFLAGLIALYFHWAVWLDLLLNIGETYGDEDLGVAVSNIKILQVFSLVTNPGVLFDLMGKVNEVGSWGISGGTVKGTFLTVIWIIELLIVVGVATLIPVGAASVPFCEEANDWFDSKKLPAFKLIEDPTRFIADIENNNTEAFNALTRADNLESHHSIFTLYSSEKGEYYLTVENKIAQEKDGKTELKGNEFVEYIDISKEIANILNSK